ncbi:MAG: glycosyltransferase family 4 protein, partial [Planctomycetaceae bacterium]
YWVDHFWDAFAIARAVRALRPRFVFAQEASSYGFAAALCRRVPRIVFPWGGDVFNYAESSPFVGGMTRFALRRADLIVPSSTTAARHIARRFGVPAEKIQAVSWGVDRSLFRPADERTRAEICREYGIDPRSILVMNVRRFRPFWGSRQAMEAFRQAAHDARFHFLLLGGSGSEAEIEQARRELSAAGLDGRFTFLEGDRPLTKVARAMSIADVFVSLVGRGDMRSSSVLQGAAAGGVPVLLESEEYRAMVREGFAALFVPPDDPSALCEVLRELADGPGRRERIVQQNQQYLSEHEDSDRQMTRLLEAIEAVCAAARRNSEAFRGAENHVRRTS